MGSVPDLDGCVVFEFDSVSKRYRDGTLAVTDLNLIIPSQKITVMVGPSGCGKTTTLRLVNRMLEPTSGTITWDGVPLQSRRKTQLRRQMGYVIQSGGLFPHRTVLDNVMTVPRLVGWTPDKARKRAAALLEEVGLDRRLSDRYPAQLSGGQQQRVGVARALAADPLVLLMDEPFSAIDPVIRDDLHALLLRLHSELEKTVIMITHDIDEAVKLGDQVVIMRVGGEIAQSGTPAELLNAPADAFVDGFIGRDRGYRSLSFTPAANLTLRKVRAVRDPGLARPGEPTLVLGPSAEPVGWADPQSERTLPLGSTFDPRTDTLRVALDSALSSPVGLAVAVDRTTGRYAGVAGTEQITALVRDERLDFARTYDPAKPVEVARPAVDSTHPSVAGSPSVAASTVIPPTVAAPSTVPAEPGTEPVSAERGTEPVSAERGTEPVSAERGTEPVSAERGTEPVSAEPGPEPMLAEPGIDPVPAELGVDPVPAERGIDPVRPEPGTEPVPVELGSEAASGEPADQPADPVPEVSDDVDEELFDQEHSVPLYDELAWPHTDGADKQPVVGSVDGADRDEADPEPPPPAAPASDPDRPITQELAVNQDSTDSSSTDSSSTDQDDQDAATPAPAPVNPTGEPLARARPDEEAQPTDAEVMPDPDQMPGPDAVGELTRPDTPARPREPQTERQGHQDGSG